ncbi:MAG: hypothetical protein IPM79_34535 [Polyangiaceae bacterium]|nr:hypothetical protein [Polyangiaceae bacterium]
MTRRLLSAAMAAALAAAPGGAAANGRFPDAQQLVVAPTDPSHMAVQVTYGFIHTRDAGASWQWTCEDAASYGGVLDPPIALLDSGAMIAGVFDGLAVTSPDGCSVGLVPGELDGRFMVDVSTIKTDPSRAIALSSDGLGSEGFDTRLWKTVDSAVTWAQLGVALPSDFLAFTVDAAPDDEDLLYVSGFTVAGSNDYVGSLAISTDAGATWTVKPIPGSANASGPYIAAIDPLDHDTVFVRLASLAGVLLVSHDAGDTWETVFEAQGALLGFALSPDGERVAVGGDVDGIWVASTSDLTFEQVNALGVRCLTWTPDALFACAREATAGFTVGKSVDEGTTFEAIHHLSCLEGPDPACADGTTIPEVCSGPWAATQQIIGATDCGEGGAGGGEGGAGGEGGSGGGGDSTDGCSCGASGSSATGLGVACIALLTLALGGRGRAPRRRSGDRASR